jgi:hypothetical protein
MLLLDCDLFDNEFKKYSFLFLFYYSLLTIMFRYTLFLYNIYSLYYFILIYIIETIIIYYFLF